MLISYPTMLLLGWCRLVARRYAVGRGCFQFPAFWAKFGLRVIWLSAVRVGGLFRVATPLVAAERPAFSVAINPLGEIWHCLHGRASGCHWPK